MTNGNDYTHGHLGGKTFCGAEPDPFRFDRPGAPISCLQCQRHQAALVQARDARRRAEKLVREHPLSPMGALRACGLLKQAAEALEDLR